MGYELVRIPNVEPYTFTHAGKDWTYIPKPKGSAVAKRDTVAMSDKLHKLLVAEIMKAGKPLALPTDTDGKAIPIVIQNIKYIVQFRALKESKKAPAAVAG